jgi:hypothetical protein
MAAALISSSDTDPPTASPLSHAKQTGIEFQGQAFRRRLCSILRAFEEWG